MLNTIADVLLVTATEVESKAVLQAFQEATGSWAEPHSRGDRVYFDLGKVQAARVSLVQSEMGAGGPGASLLTVQKGIDALRPAAVIMVGIAFGTNAEKQRLGDVLVAEGLRLYEFQRVGVTNTTAPGGGIILRGDRPHASPWLINHFKSAALRWTGARVKFGVLMTGEKLVDNLDYRNQLCSLEPEAIGGEMEGAGLYSACHDRKVDWILVKAICDWADGNKDNDKDARQLTAAKNAVQFVLHGLSLAAVNWDQRRQGASGFSDLTDTLDVSSLPAEFASIQEFFPPRDEEGDDEQD